MDKFSQLLPTFLKLISEEDPTEISYRNIIRDEAIITIIKGPRVGNCLGATNIIRDELFVAEYEIHLGESQYRISYDTKATGDHDMD